MTFSKEDIIQIEVKGLTVKQVVEQIKLFKSGLVYINIKNPATVGNGILKLSENEEDLYIKRFEKERHHRNLIKFVPASGAASRMFQFLFQFLETYNPKQETLNAYINKNKATALSVFLVGLNKFPFYEEVLKKTKSYFPNFNNLSKDEKYFSFIKTMLDADKLNISALPKGLLAFHKYKAHQSSAFEEHLFEAALYASSNNTAKLHFTISKNHLTEFKDTFKQIQSVVEKKTGTTFHISYSLQDENTDTIAVTPQNKLFRDHNNKLIFRPSGHGALLNNLNNIDADLIFIKNIDNVVISKYENEVAHYKKILAGILLNIQQQVFQYLNELDNKTISEDKLNHIAQFLSSTLNVILSADFKKYSSKYKKEYLQNKLNRPIRVCGIVKNESEPGGGPFWVMDDDGIVSLQIVESAQIDINNKQQKHLINKATHFNPVDIVCAIKDYKGKTFNLRDYVDPKTAFISMKTKTGKHLKALELPGLWNGSMAHWNTIFVEVPLITFNPVKTVNDLLKNAHQID